MARFRQQTRMPVSADALYRWHARPGAFERLAPPWETMETVEATGGIEDGARRVFDIQQGPLSVRWVAEHRDHVEGRQFVDEQVRGPFARWVHTHRFEERGDGQSLLIDDVEYALPGGPLGSLVGGAKTETMLQRMFAFRHRRTADDLRRHAVSDVDGALRVAITGSSGSIGRALAAFLETGGHQVLRLVRDRHRCGDGAIYWSPADGDIDGDALEGIDAVVHLAGEPVQGRWTDDKRRAIEDSRVDGTELLARTLAGLDEPPEVFVSASAIGYYGDTGDAMVDENGALGDGFLSEVCRGWEAAAEPARRAGIRTVWPRFGVVLDPGHGALPEMLHAVKFGMASRLGSGDQYVSWIDIDDAIAAIFMLIRRSDLAGPFNITAPSPVTNRALLSTIGDVVNRPNVVPVPASALQIALGERAAREMVLVSQRAMPTRLEEAGFEFFYGDLEASLQMKLGRLASAKIDVPITADAS